MHKLKIVSIAIAVFFMGLGIFSVATPDIHADTTPVVSELNKPIQAKLQATIGSDDMPVEAKHILVTDLSTGEVLFNRDADTPQPLASLTKLMTAITVRTITDTWKNPPKQIRLVAKSAAWTKADRELAVGGYMSIDDLTSYMLLTSSNFAAQSLANGFMPFPSFVSYMNFSAKNLGLKHSNFINASGLTEANGAASTGSASDIMKMLAFISKRYPKLAEATRSAEAHIETDSGKMVTIENTNKLLGDIPGLYLGKTGFTDEAGGNLAIVIRRNDHLYGIVVMGSTVEGRFDETAQIASLI